MKPRCKSRNSLWPRSCIVVLAGMAGWDGGNVARGAEPLQKWDSSFAAGWTVNSGNSDSILMTASLRGRREWEWDEWTVDLSGAYGKTDGEKNTELGHGLGQYRRLLDERWYVTAVADLWHDGVADLSYRLTVGPGAGVYITKSASTRLNLEAGPSWVHQKYRGQTPTDYMAVRVSERWEHRFTKGVKVWQTVDFLPQVDDSSNYKVIGEVGLETALTKALSLRVVGQDRYDSQPVGDRKRNDITLLTAVAFKF